MNSSVHSSPVGKTSRAVLRRPTGDVDGRGRRGRRKHCCGQVTWPPAWSQAQPRRPPGPSAVIRDESTNSGTEWKLRNMRARRSGSIRLASLGGALVLAAGTVAALQIGTTAASAAPVSENFASYAAAFGLFVPASLTTNITQPALVKPNATYSMAVGSNTQNVPASLSGFPIVYTTGLKTVIPVPSGATYVAGSLPTGLTWTFVDNGVTTHGPFSLVYCTAAGPNCNATAHSSHFSDPPRPPTSSRYRVDPVRRRWELDPPRLERFLQGNRSDGTRSSRPSTSTTTPTTSEAWASSPRCRTHPGCSRDR